MINITAPNSKPVFFQKTPWAWIVGTVCGAGVLKPGPGTFGSIAALLWWMAAAHVLHPTAMVLALGTLVAAVAVTLIGIPAATIVAKESRSKDPQHVVIDEFAGQLIALIAIRPDWPHALLSLALFRLFDITKPPPCRKLENLPGGTGIMMDDVAAGIYALVIAHLVSIWF
jgi:phosphatidylglycerophosphatase A